jgi:DNA replication protein
MDEQLKSIQIQGLEFRYNPNKDYVKEGNVYCKTCHNRVNSEPIPMAAMDKVFIVRVNCECDKTRIEQEKQEERFREIEQKKKDCFLQRNQWDYTFEQGESSMDSELARKLKNYVKKFDQMKAENIGLLLYGNVGSGKTYLACCVANAIISEYLVSVKVRNLSQILNDLQKGGFELDRNDYIDRITNPTLLVLDDFGIERNTEYALEQVYNVINSRYLKAKPTIITTNLNFRDMEQPQEDVIQERIYSRIMEMCIPLRVIGTDKRKEISLEKIKKARAWLEE